MDKGEGIGGTRLGCNWFRKWLHPLPVLCLNDSSVKLHEVSYH